MLKKIVCISVLLGLLFSFALAEQEVLLPGERYIIELPDWMEYSDAVDGGTGMDAYVSKDLEMDYLSYRKEDAVMLGMAQTLRETAEERAAQGADVELRKVNGIEMLCFRLQDEEDGTPCIGYLFEDGELLIEIDFWYATQEAADETKKIMESIREKDA